eukprot:TRINITY_DN317_c1_g4_i2.p1 TRINITY_DN317_c1_g4~~TRINITY_DN317_c1_g4_i2.p1  ORF type:complete len:417 (+),score=138.56 TRINITY_DN317_c1_g4_i2:188-1252(+)
MSVPETTPAMEAIAGSIGGCLALTITYPLQSVSMLLQMHEKDKKASSGDLPCSSSQCDSLGPSEDSDAASNGATDESTPAQGSITPKQARLARPSRGSAPLLKRNSTVALISSVIKERQGLKGLYSGLGSSLFGQLIIQAVYYYFYSWARNLATRISGSSSGAIHTAICASIAGSLGCVTTNPIWVVSTRQIKTGSKKPLTTELKELYEEEGLAGFFKGIGPALLLVSNPTIQYSAFEKLSQVYTAAVEAKKRGLTSLEIFFLSALAKICSTLCTYPYIMAKTTLQSQVRSDDPDTQYNTTLDCLKGVFRREGFVGLYSGLNSKIWQSVLTAALMFVLHNKILQVVKRLMTVKA